MLVSFLIVFLLYCVYHPLRFSIDDPERQARYSSVFAIAAGAFVPINFIAVRLAEPSTLHPRVLSQTGGSLPGEMRLTFLVSLARRGAAVRDAVEARADVEERVDAAGKLRSRLEHAPPSRPRSRPSRPGGPLTMLLPLAAAGGKYVAAAYVVFLTLVVIYVAIIGVEDRAHRARARRTASS